jgi:integrase
MTIEYQPSRQNKKALAKIAKAKRLVSATNRPSLDALCDHLDGLGRSPKTAAPYARLLQMLDAHVGAKPFAEVKPDELRSFMASIRSPKVRTNRTNGDSLKAALNHLQVIQTGNPIPEGDPLRRAIARPQVQKRMRTLHILSDETMRALLDAAAEPPSQFRNTDWTIEVQAFVQHLRFGGWRIEEDLSLNGPDVQLDGLDAAWVTLREEAPLLGQGDHKTGARRIYIAEGIPALRAWMDVHPTHAAPGDPLWTSFPSMFQGKPVRRLTTDSVDALWDRLVARSGIAESMPSDFNLTSHLWRHTCATAKAKLGWNEAQLRAYFGWSDESDEPAAYVHLAAADMRARVREDHGLDSAGIAKPVVEDFRTMVAQEVARVLAGRLDTA